MHSSLLIMARELQKAKDKSDTKFMKVSTESGEDDSSVTDSQTSFTDLLKHLIMQDERRTEKELKHE